jgi:hypothetical protein
VSKRQDHAAEGKLLRQVLATFPAEGVSKADGAIRRRVEGAVIASDLAADGAQPRPPTDAGEDPSLAG